MGLRSELEESGSWLYRYRSYLPFSVVPLFLLSLASSSYLGHIHEFNGFWQTGCMAVSFSGLALRMIVVGHAPYKTCGRNTRKQVANSLNKTGIYSVVRHPLYLANYIIIIGFTAAFHVWWLVLLTTTIYALYYERIMLAEEAFLSARFGAEFENWAAVTPAFIPKFRGWKPFKVPFCWRTVLQREYHAFFLIIAAFFLLDLIDDSLAEKRLMVDARWLAVFISGFVIFITLRTLKKRTRLLTVNGR